MSKNIDKNELLKEFLKSLSTNKWTNVNYSSVVLKSSSSEAIWSSNFPLKLRDLTTFFISKSLENIQLPIREQFIEMKTQERLETILISYLNQFKDNKLIIKRLVEYFKSPESLFSAPEPIYSISDKFWNLIEDSSVDFNFYTKRFILMSVIVPTTLFWIKDASDNNLDTTEYMKKCFKRSMKIGKIKNKIKESLSRFL
ncbi:COQ9 family protein [Pelagibacterales bacterium]|nr:COQ9 family protein [Pelagibacterales bacterium]